MTERNDRGNRPSLTHPDRLTAMNPSGLREIHNIYLQLKAQDPSRSFIPLHLGEPDRGTPQFIIDAACRALNNGAVFYEPNAGRMDLRDALVEHFRRRYGVALTPDNYVVTCGGTQAIAGPSPVSESPCGVPNSGVPKSSPPPTAARARSSLTNHSIR